MAEYVTFGLTSSLALLLAGKVDVVYVNSWPLFGVGPAVAAARAKRIPVVISVQDVYPESLVAQRRLRASALVTRLLRAMDGAIACRATRLLVLDERFREEYARTRAVAAGRIEAIANFVTSESVIPNCGDGSRIRERHGVDEDALLAVYAGNIGPASAVEELLRAFAMIRTASPVYLLVAGQGSRLAGCRRLAAELKNSRLAFESPWQVEETSAILAAADILVLPTRGEQATVSMPSKLIAYMLAARPVIVQAAQETALADVVRTARCGLVVPAGDAEAMAGALERMAMLSPSERAAMGASGRAYALEHFTEEACLPRIIAVLRGAAARHDGKGRLEGSRRRCPDDGG